MSEYDNRKKELKNAVFWVLFAFFFAKEAPDFGFDTPLSKLLCIFKENRVLLLFSSSKYR